MFFILKLKLDSEPVEIDQPKFYTQYLGCYSYNPLNKHSYIIFSNLTITKCLKHCSFLNMSNVLSADKCYCTMPTSDQKINNINCFREAKVDRHFTGGNETIYSLYSLKSFFILKLKEKINFLKEFIKKKDLRSIEIIEIDYKYNFIGCFERNFHQVLLEDSNSTEFCIDFCAKLNFSYAGLRYQ